MKSAVKLAVPLLVAALAVTVLSNPAVAYRVLRPAVGPTSEDGSGAGIDASLQTPEDDEVAEGAAVVTSPAIWVRPVTSTVLVGDVFTVEVMKTSDEALGAFNFHFAWDPTIIEFQGVAKGAGLAADADITDTRKGPFIRQVIGFHPEEIAPAGTVAVAEFEFQALDTGSSPLDIIDSTEAEDYPEDLKIEGVTLADTELNSLPDVEVMDSQLRVGRVVFLPLVLKNR